jgi:diguanylate cyclase (GGDEF)-like protein
MRRATVRARAAALGAVLAAVYLLSPNVYVAETAWLAVMAGSCGAIVLGVRHNRPRDVRPWWTLLAGLGLLTGGYLLTFPLWSTPGVEVVGHLSHLVAYPTLGVAALLLVRAQEPAGDREGTIDGTIVMIALATVLAGTVFHHVQFDPQSGALAWLATLAAPLLPAAVMAATFRLLFAGNARVASAWLIAAAATSATVGAVARTLLEAQGTYERGQWSDVFIVAASVCVGLAAWHPSSVRLTELRTATDRKLTYGRLAVLGAALVAAPVTLVTTDPVSGLSLPVAASMVVSLLVLWRLARLVVDREEVRRALHQRAVRQEAVAVLGLHALDESDLNALFREASRMSIELLDLEECRITLEARPEVPAGAVTLQLVGSDGANSGVLVATRREGLDDEDLAFLQTVSNLLAGAVQRHETRLEIRHRAVHDPLTGLPNRTLLLDRVQHALARSAREHATLAVMFVDLDGFKAVNDDLGHHAGDELLIAVAQRLRTALRQPDTLARLAGDEFVIVCEGIDRESADAIATRLIDVLRAPVPLEAGVVSVRASIGVTLSEPGMDADRLLRDADAAMYRAKEHGGTYAFFDDSLRIQLARRRHLEQLLPAAAERGELELVYQPLVAITDPAPTVVGVEALLRWVHADEGPVTPAEFIPIADAAGLISDLGEWVLRTACRQLAEWEAHLPGDDAFTLYVNVSPRQLTEPGFLDRLSRAVDDSGVNPRHLGLEVTETAILDEDGIAMLARVREVGVKLALDDFGTGFSSLAHLKRIELDLIKIDRLFVSGLSGREAKDQAIVAAVAAVAHQLAIPVLGEGVETPDQVEVLRELGCDLAQGYHFGRPQPAAHLEGLFAGGDDAAPRPATSP